MATDINRRHVLGGAVAVGASDWVASANVG